MTKQKEQLREKVENLIYYGTDGFFMKDQTVSRIIKLLKDQREEIIRDMKNWTKGKKVTKDKVREYLNCLKEND